MNPSATAGLGVFHAQHSAASSRPTNIDTSRQATTDAKQEANDVKEPDFTFVAPGSLLLRLSPKKPSSNATRVGPFGQHSRQSSSSSAPSTPHVPAGSGSSSSASHRDHVRDHQRDGPTSKRDRMPSPLHLTTGEVREVLDYRDGRGVFGNICWYYPGACRHGSRCIFKHLDDKDIARLLDGRYDRETLRSLMTDYFQFRASRGEPDDQRRRRRPDSSEGRKRQETWKRSETPPLRERRRSHRGSEDARRNRRDESDSENQYKRRVHFATQDRRRRGSRSRSPTRNAYACERSREPTRTRRSPPTSEPSAKRSATVSSKLPDGTSRSGGTASPTSFKSDRRQRADSPPCALPKAALFWAAPKPEPNDIRTERSAWGSLSPESPDDSTKQRPLLDSDTNSLAQQDWAESTLAAVRRTWPCAEAWDSDGQTIAQSDAWLSPASWEHNGSAYSSVPVFAAFKQRSLYEKHESEDSEDEMADDTDYHPVLPKDSDDTGRRKPQETGAFLASVVDSLPGRMQCLELPDLKKANPDWAWHLL